MPADRSVIYSTFDAEGLPAPFAEDQVKPHRGLGFRTLVIDTSPRLSPERVAAWERPFVKRQLVRENPRADPFVPSVPPADPRDNACIERWLRSTDAYHRRYGRHGRRAVD